MRFIHNPLLAPHAACLLLLLALAGGSLLDAPTLIAWTAEESLVETLTPVLYLMAALAACGDRERHPAPLWLALATLMMAAAARELDLHKAFTDVSIMKLSYYLGPSHWRHKLVALAFVASTVLSTGYLVLRLGPPFRHGLRQRHPVALTVATFLLVMVMTKLLDRLLGVLAQDFGWRTGEDARALQLAVEELMEMGLPVLVLLALVQYRTLELPAALLAPPAAVKEKSLGRVAAAHLMPSDRPAD